MDERFELSREEATALVEGARDYRPDEVATAVEYAANFDCLILQMKAGFRVFIPREELQFVAKLTALEASHVALAEGGTVVEWDGPGIDFNVGALVRGARGNARWMAELGERRSAVAA